MELILNIFCHLERLGPEYDELTAAEKFYYFSLNLTAALTGEETASDIEAAITKYLRLWNWDWLNLAVRGVKKNAADQDISEEIMNGFELIPDGLSNDEKAALLPITLSLQTRLLAKSEIFEKQN